MVAKKRRGKPWSRGLSSPKPVRGRHWCVYITPLETIFKGTARPDGSSAVRYPCPEQESNRRPQRTSVIDYRAPTRSRTQHQRRFSRWLGLPTGLPTWGGVMTPKYGADSGIRTSREVIHIPDIGRVSVRRSRVHTSSLHPASVRRSRAGYRLCHTHAHAPSLTATGYRSTNRRLPLPSRLRSSRSLRPDKHGEPHGSAQSGRSGAPSDDYTGFRTIHGLGPHGFGGQYTAPVSIIPHRFPPPSVRGCSTSHG